MKLLDNTIDYFDIIYRAAIDQDIQTLKILRKDGICLSEYKGLDTPISSLAKHGEIDAVNFLLNHFNLSINHAVCGYAQAGNVTEVNKLLAEGASVSLAVLGYAMAGITAQVNLLIARGASLELALKGYAYIGNVYNINDLLTAHAEGDNYALQFIVEGYASGGHVALVNQALARLNFNESAIWGYIIGGYNDETKRISRLNISHPCGMEIEAYAIANNVTELQPYFDCDFPDQIVIESALRGFASGGHVQQVNHILSTYSSRARIAMVTHCYLKQDHYDGVNSIDHPVYSYVTKDIINYLNAKCEMSMLAVSEEQSLRLMVHFENNVTTKAIAKQSHVYLPEINPSELRRTAKKIQVLMNDEDMSYLEARIYIMLMRT